MVKRVTLADVAELAGVSKTAASLILNDRPGSRLSADVADRVRAAAQALDYRPNPAARSLRSGKTRTVGFISDDVTVTRYASAMIRGALDVADQHHHTVLIAEVGSSPDRVRSALEAMIDRRADGVIFASMAARQIDVPTVPEDVPVVLLNVTSADKHASVLPAERQAGYEVARFVLERGHRRIGLIGHSTWAIQDLRRSATIRHRFAGIDQAFAETGVDLVIAAEQVKWEPRYGYASMSKILSDGLRVTAMICLNDNLAFGAYQAMQERGVRIPADVSVISFDDDVLAEYLRPRLTTARIPYEDMGRRAMELILSGEPPTGEHLIGMPLQVRDSVRQL